MSRCLEEVSLSEQLPLLTGQRDVQSDTGILGLPLSIRADLKEKTPVLQEWVSPQGITHTDPNFPLHMLPWGCLFHTIFSSPLPKNTVRFLTEVNQNPFCFNVFLEHFTACLKLKQEYPGLRTTPSWANLPSFLDSSKQLSLPSRLYLF